MPILVPSSTWQVPDGYHIPTVYPWVGNLSTGDVLTVHWSSSQAGVPTTHTAWDIILTDLVAVTSLTIANPAWGGTAGSGTITIPHDSSWGVGFEIGGINAGDGPGTVFGFQLGVTYATPGFNPSDAALTTQLANTLAPFDWATSSVFHGWTGNGSLELETGVTAIAWTFSQLPPIVPSSGGTPNYYFGFGFATPITKWGAERSTRVSFSPQLMRLPSSVRTVDFFLVSGLALDITQLVPSSGATLP